MTDDDFEAFWKEYPGRLGDRNKAGARRTFQNKVKQGVDPQKIIAAAKAYARARPWAPAGVIYQKHMDRFIPMASRWLNDKRYEDYPQEEATLALPPEKEAELLERYRQRRIREGWT